MSGDQCFCFLFPTEGFELQELELDPKTALEKVQNYEKLRLPHLQPVWNWTKIIQRPVMKGDHSLTHIIPVNWL